MLQALHTRKQTCPVGKNCCSDPQTHVPRFCEPTESFRKYVELRKNEIAKTNSKNALKTAHSKTGLQKDSYEPPAYDTSFQHMPCPESKKSTALTERTRTSRSEDVSSPESSCIESCQHPVFVPITEENVGGEDPDILSALKSNRSWASILGKDVFHHHQRRLSFHYKSTSKPGMDSPLAQQRRLDEKEETDLGLARKYHSVGDVLHVSRIATRFPVPLHTRDTSKAQTMGHHVSKPVVYRPKCNAQLRSSFAWSSLAGSSNVRSSKADSPHVRSPKRIPTSRKSITMPFTHDTLYPRVSKVIEDGKCVTKRDKCYGHYSASRPTPCAHCGSTKMSNALMSEMKEWFTAALSTIIEHFKDQQLSLLTQQLSNDVNKLLCSVQHLEKYMAHSLERIDALEQPRGDTSVFSFIT